MLRDALAGATRAVCDTEFGEAGGYWNLKGVRADVDYLYLANPSRRCFHAAGGTGKVAAYLFSAKPYEWVLSRSLGKEASLRLGQQTTESKAEPRKPIFPLLQATWKQVHPASHLALICFIQGLRSRV